MRARVKATGDASWQWGLDFYKNSTHNSSPMKEGGISDWYFAEHDWIDVVVGPIELINPKPQCTAENWESSVSSCVKSVQTKTYTKKTSKTVQRDLNTLRKMDLVVREGRRVRANREIILSFLPLKHKA